jgi:glycosyltransferase 2 family protein
LWAILHALGVNAGALWAVGVFAAGSLAGGLSILPGGVGTAEAGMVALLIAGDVPSSTAFAATLLVRLLTLGFGAALGGICYFGWTLKRRGHTAPHLRQG